MLVVQRNGRRLPTTYVYDNLGLGASGEGRGDAGPWHLVCLCLRPEAPRLELQWQSQILKEPELCLQGSNDDGKFNSCSCQNYV